jgi:magnesium chelatase family protein
VAAMNPCRCGHLGDPALACARAPRCAADYQAKVSGPLLDRIDLHVEVQAVSAADVKHRSVLDSWKLVGLNAIPDRDRRGAKRLYRLPNFRPSARVRKSAGPVSVGWKRREISPRSA